MSLFVAQSHRLFNESRFVCVTRAPIKMTFSKICHLPGTTYYQRTKRFKPYRTIAESLMAGGRMPKK